MLILREIPFLGELPFIQMAQKITAIKGEMVQFAGLLCRYVNEKWHPLLFNPCITSSFKTLLSWPGDHSRSPHSFLFFLNRFVRRMIQCFHKGEAASVSLTVISLSLPAFVLMSSFYIHCKLITFLNHHQAHGSLLWLLFILDCKMNCVFYIYIYVLSFISASFLPSSFLWFW